MAHFASLAEAAIIFPLLGNFVDIASFPTTSPRTYPASTALFRNVLLPRQFMLLSFAVPIEGPATAAHLPHIHQTHHTHTCSCNVLPHQYWVGQVEGSRLTNSMYEIENDKTKLWKTVKICCSGYPHFAAQRMLLDNNFSPLSDHCRMRQATNAAPTHTHLGRGCSHFLACWHCKILISILMSNCRSV